MKFSDFLAWHAGMWGWGVKRTGPGQPQPLTAPVSLPTVGGFLDTVFIPTLHIQAVHMAHR